jgi:hypothetical protein
MLAALNEHRCLFFLLFLSFGDLPTCKICEYDKTRKLFAKPLSSTAPYVTGKTINSFSQTNFIAFKVLITYLVCNLWFSLCIEFTVVCNCRCRACTGGNAIAGKFLHDSLYRLPAITDDVSKLYVSMTEPRRISMLLSANAQTSDWVSIWRRWCKYSTSSYTVWLESACFRIWMMEAGQWRFYVIHKCKNTSKDMNNMIESNKKIICYENISDILCTPTEKI